MGTSIGLLELKSVPVGVATADEMLKAANVELLASSPICPGKYIIIIGGSVGAVKSAMEAGRLRAGSFMIAEHTINNVHETLPAAILGVTDVEKVAALGVVETISALTAIRAGDIAAKASNVRLMEVRVARGLGGKGFIIFTGEVSAVNSAVKACVNGLEQSGEITSYCTIPSPHPELIKRL